MWSVGKTSLSGETPLLFSFSGYFCRELDKLSHVGASQVALVVKNPPAMQEPQETWVRSLGREDLLEEGMAAHSSVLAWRIPWTEESNGLWSVRSQRVRYY